MFAFYCEHIKEVEIWLKAYTINTNFTRLLRFSQITNVLVLDGRSSGQCNHFIWFIMYLLEEEISFK